MLPQKYRKLTRYTTDMEIIHAILLLAAKGIIDLRVSLPKNILARRAPTFYTSKLYRLDRELNPFFNIPSDCSIIASTIAKSMTQSEYTDINSYKFDEGKADYLLPPEDMLPTSEDIYNFTPSDLVYIDKKTLYELATNEQGYIRAFISPEITDTILTSLAITIAEPDKANNLINDHDYPLDLAHGVPFRPNHLTCHENLRNNKSVAFYNTLADSALAYFWLRDLFPITEQKYLTDLRFSDSELDKMLDSWDMTSPDTSWLLEYANMRFKKLKWSATNERKKIIRIISYTEKWLPAAKFEESGPLTYDNIHINIEDGNKIFFSSQFPTKTNDKNFEKKTLLEEINDILTHEHDEDYEKASKGTIKRLKYKNLVYKTILETTLDLLSRKLNKKIEEGFFYDAIDATINNLIINNDYVELKKSMGGGPATNENEILIYFENLWDELQNRQG